MGKTFRVAIVGYGLAGAVFHAPLVKATEGMRVSHIVTRSSEKQAQANNDFPEARIVSGFEQMIELAENIDLAVIATPNLEHARQANACMEAGLACVLDKPIAVNSRECKSLIDASKRTGVFLSVFQNRRWDNDFLTIKKLISDGVLGKVLRFESRFERYRPQPKDGAWRERLSAGEGGGILFDLGSHLIDQACQLFGKPDKIYAEVLKRREAVASDDDSFLALSFPSGAQAHLWMSALSASQGHRFRVLGSEGAYEKYGLDPQEEALRAGKSPLDAGFGLEPEGSYGKLTTYKDGIVQVNQVPTVAGRYLSYYEGVRDALAEWGTERGRAPVCPTEALLSLEIIEKALAGGGSL